MKNRFGSYDLEVIYAGKGKEIRIDLREIYIYICRQLQNFYQNIDEGMKSSLGISILFLKYNFVQDRGKYCIKHKKNDKNLIPLYSRRFSIEK